jgi:hypothetical protein
MAVGVDDEQIIEIFHYRLPPVSLVYGFAIRQAV